jgi:histidinol-phosphatase
MPRRDLADDLNLALRLADAAREISLARFRGRFEVRVKPDGSLVTEVDEAVEDELRRMLGSERPEDAILGEERGPSGSGERRWLIDAIDGTHSFASGTPHWGTLIALEVAGRVVLGVCDDPPIDRRYWAGTGLGAFRTDGVERASRIRVSRTEALPGARSFVPSPEWVTGEQTRAMAGALTAITNPTPADDHPALQVASGGYDLAVFFAAGPWDVAAPSIVVEEAGGKFTNIAGEQTLTGGAVFSNGLIHDAAIECLRAAREP